MLKPLKLPQLLCMAYYYSGREAPSLKMDLVCSFVCFLFFLGSTFGLYSWLVGVPPEKCEKCPTWLYGLFLRFLRSLTSRTNAYASIAGIPVTPETPAIQAMHISVGVDPHWILLSILTWVTSFRQRSHFTLQHHLYRFMSNCLAWMWTIHILIL